MFGLLKLIGGKKELTEKEAVIERLQKLNTKQSTSAGSEREEIQELDVLNHKSRAVLLSNDLSSERDRWPKLRNSNASAPRYAGNNDGFWDRAKNAQNDLQRNRARILASVRVR